MTAGMRINPRALPPGAIVYGCNARQAVVLPSSTTTRVDRYWAGEFVSSAITDDVTVALAIVYGWLDLAEEMVAS